MDLQVERQDAFHLALVTRERRAVAWREGEVAYFLAPGKEEVVE